MFQVVYKSLATHFPHFSHTFWAIGSCLRPHHMNLLRSLMKGCLVIDLTSVPEFIAALSIWTLWPCFHGIMCKHSHWMWPFAPFMTWKLTCIRVMDRTLDILICYRGRICVISPYLFLSCLSAQGMLVQFPFQILLPIVWWEKKAGYKKGKLKPNSLLNFAPSLQCWWQQYGRKGLICLHTLDASVEEKP